MLSLLRSPTRAHRCRMSPPPESRVRWDIGKERSWHRVPRTSVSAPSLEASKTTLDGA